ncbi:MAG: bifunctional phosphopantothenoylcysteine decarboxylase/phosphopantothenate--cysteine ligase CoaBC [Acidimicrobiales bacterium]
MLGGRRVVLGVAGGIGAYKAIEVCRRLVDAGAHVSPVLTADATRFVTATTFSALASEPARTSLWDSPEPSPHTTLGGEADLVVVAPATARLLAAYRLGLADDLLVALLLATRAPVICCPAMHAEMWEHAAVQENVAVLRRRGVEVVGPVVGRLAGGDVGAGRLAEPADIVTAAAAVLAGAGRPGGRAGADLAGLTVLVTAGGTREPLDPVRYLGNRSSGRQGHALAEEAAGRGAAVTLVTTATPPPAATGGVEVVPVETAAEMERAVLDRGPAADVVVMAAAVADFRPKVVAGHKLRRADGVPELVLEPTPDILAALVASKRGGQTLVGFAAETGDARAGGLDKLARKGLDLVVANDVSAPGAGFGHDTNAVVVLSASGESREVPLSDKRAVARAILDAVTENRSRT